MDRSTPTLHRREVQKMQDMAAQVMRGLVDPRAVRLLFAGQEPVAGTGQHLAEPAAALIHHLAVEGRLR